MEMHQIRYFLALCEEGLTRPGATRLPRLKRSGLSRRHHHARPRLVQDEAFNWVEFARPGCRFKHMPRIRVSGLPAGADTLRTEINVLRMVLTLECGSEQSHHM